MATLLKLRQAARLIGVSPGRLYRAITDGRLTAAPGGGPGKATLVSLEAIQAFCRSEGLRVPESAEIVERSERSERSEHLERPERAARPERSPMTDDALVRQTIETMTAQYLAQILAKQSDYLEAFVRQELSHLVERVAEQVVEQVVERLTERLERAARLERPERPERLERSEHVERLERSTPVLPSPKAMIVERLRAMQADGLSLQAMANRLNAEGVPTFSGKGRWQKGTIGNLLAQGEVREDR